MKLSCTRKKRIINKVENKIWIECEKNAIYATTRWKRPQSEKDTKTLRRGTRPRLNQSATKRLPAQHQRAANAQRIVPKLVNGSPAEHDSKSSVFRHPLSNVAINCAFSLPCFDVAKVEDGPEPPDLLAVRMITLTEGALASHQKVR